MEALSIKKCIDKITTIRLIALLLFSVLTYSQTQSSKDCNTAYRICDATQSYYFEASNDAGMDDDSYIVISGGGTPYPTIQCIAGNTYPTPEWHPAWFVFTAQYSGEFGFLICPEVTTIDWQWALFESPVCGNLDDTSHQLACNVNSPAPVVQGCTGIGFKGGFGGGGTNGLLAYVNVTAGNTYVLYASISDSNLTAPQRATLSFQGQVVIDHPDVFDFAGCTMSTNDFDLQSKVKIYPNPFQDFINIESEIDLKTIELYDVMGKQVIRQDFVKRLDTSKIAKGFYLLKLTTEDGSIINKKIMR